MTALASTVGQSLSQTVYGTLDYWKMAASDGKLLIKTADLAGAIEKLCMKHLSDVQVFSTVGETAGCFSNWAKPAGLIYKPFSDGVEPFKDLLQTNFLTEDRIKLFAKIALVAGLLLGIPQYLADVNMISLGAFGSQIGIINVITIMDLARRTLITIGTVHKLYESGFYKIDTNGKSWKVWTWSFAASSKIGQKNAALNRAAENKSHWDDKMTEAANSGVSLQAPLGDGSPLNCKHWVAAKKLEKAQLDSWKAYFDLGDNVTKVAEYGVFMCSAFYAPVDAHVAFVAMKAANKVFGCAKDYVTVKSDFLSANLTAWAKQNGMDDARRMDVSPR